MSKLKKATDGNPYIENVFVVFHCYVKLLLSVTPIVYWTITVYLML